MPYRRVDWEYQRGLDYAGWIDDLADNYGPCDCGADDWRVDEGVGLHHGSMVLTCENCGEVNILTIERR